MSQVIKIHQLHRRSNSVRKKHDNRHYNVTVSEKLRNNHLNVIFLNWHIDAEASVGVSLD